jgi:DNA-directed RNA polymerase subunit omega
MARVTIEDCLERVENRFALVHLTVRRVLQLRRGATPLVDAPKNKEVVVALREIADGQVSTENIRKFEELEALPEATMPAARAQKIMHEVEEEILEATTRFPGEVEFEGKQVEDAPFQETEEES